MLSSTATYTAALREVGQGQLVLRGAKDTPPNLASSVPGPSTLPISSQGPAASRPALFTWSQLLDIVSTGNLQKLSRHPEDLREYFAWIDQIKLRYGSVHSYLLAEKLTAPKLIRKGKGTVHPAPLSKGFSEATCFQSHFVPGEDCQILVNDWPYSIPKDVTHHVVWSHLPILHRDLVDDAQFDSVTTDLAWAVIAKRGLCGTLSPLHGLQIPSIHQHLVHLPTLLPENTDEAQKDRIGLAVKSACSHLVDFINTHWDLERHEACFFANPPSLQSVPSLAHFHVLIRPLSS
ncbi:hypothetical protein BCV70DRAFT_159925 [Testicularia cyperi]|uniref:Uncharacterized protein n=1 Tax=Testicularia cyperi TaxID=1882483 RepID=A0A317XRW3_9BASI|nr:hypothetical protein BCV70DRAFT_159925 [Testicularia cyperi]